jgi:hypothetical protein
MRRASTWDTTIPGTCSATQAALLDHPIATFPVLTSAAKDPGQHTVTAAVRGSRMTTMENNRVYTPSNGRELFWLAKITVQVISLISLLD